MTAKKPFPTTLFDIQNELEIHAKDGRSDALFRQAIVLDQFGAFTRHITHDKHLNPSSRPHGSRESEVNDAGHFLVQAMTLVALRGINIQSAVNSAMVNLREKDFIARVGSESGPVKGVTACTAKGSMTAKAWVCKEGLSFPTGQWNPLILVASHPEADARIKQFAGIITDHGGMNCHAAIIARENGIPCIVGTGNATKRIQHGDLIHMDTIDGIAIVNNS